MRADEERVCNAVEGEAELEGRLFGFGAQEEDEIARGRAVIDVLF